MSQYTEADYEAIVKRLAQNVRVGEVRPVRVGTTTTARTVAPSARLAPSPYFPYKSKLEVAFSRKLELEKTAGLILGFWYEPFSFRLADGKRYRVDFLRWNLDRTTDCIEIKGYHANMRDSLTHLSWAAQRFPFHRWWLVQRDDVGWKEKRIPSELAEAMRQKEAP